MEDECRVENLNPVAAIKAFSVPAALHRSEKKKRKWKKREREKQLGAAPAASLSSWFNRVKAVRKASESLKFRAQKLQNEAQEEQLQLPVLIRGGEKKKVVQLVVEGGGLG